MFPGFIYRFIAQFDTQSLKSTSFALNGVFFRGGSFLSQFQVKMIKGQYETKQIALINKLVALTKLENQDDSILSREAKKKFWIDKR